MEFEKKSVYVVELSEMEAYVLCEALEKSLNAPAEMADVYETAAAKEFMRGVGYDSPTEMLIKANRHGTKLPYPDAAPRYPGYPQEEDLITDIMKEKNY